MEDTAKNLWNTKTTDMTVGDNIKFNAALLALLGGATAATVIVPVVAHGMVKKFRSMRENRQKTNLTVVED